MHKPTVIRSLFHFKGIGDTLHVQERFARVQAYRELLSEDFLYFFVVDTGHPNGLEVHAINLNGLIYIYNLESRLLITIMHPRIPQLRRYFEQLGKTMPRRIYELGKGNEARNKALGLNQC